MTLATNLSASFLVGDRSSWHHTGDMSPLRKVPRSQSKTDMAVLAETLSWPRPNVSLAGCSPPSRWG